MTRMPTYFIPHGVGPCFFMDPRPGTPADTWDRMADFLKKLPEDLPEPPKAVLIISAHWLTDVPTMITTEAPELYFDYYGFPPHTYELTWPAKTSGWLAARTKELLNDAGYRVAEETERGLDHGVFVPFKLIYPDADMPILQLSMLNTDNAAEQIRYGQALAKLRDEGVLIIGSGLSYHNLRQFYHQPLVTNPDSVAFDDWLTDAATDTDGRNDKLAQWLKVPTARAVHPTSEHLLPMMIAAGAATGDQGEQIYSDIVLGKAVSGYRFG